MKDIEKFEKLVDDIEKYMPTAEYIKEQANIDVVSVKKYFPKAYRAKKTVITGVYIIFTESKEKYIGSSKNILREIDIFMRNSTIKNILVVYIYETGHIDTKKLELWLEYKLKNINYHDKELTEHAVPKKIEDATKNINIRDIIPKNIDITRCIDNIRIRDTRNISHSPGTYILQFTDGECYVGSCRNLYSRMMTHRRYSDYISGISICETQNTIDAQILEHIFIKILKPKYNCIPGSDKYGKKISINTPYKTTNVINESKYRKIKVPEYILRLLDDKRNELYEQGIFSLSTQELLELAIKEGLNVICENIRHISEMDKIEEYINSQRYYYY